ncbi:MAG: carboxypeptidase-like regulatory domain-containing protein [Bacteroidales bacterium]|nr:carboxypeptidase-like regulatory domain-containing protein [Bacteroidales bacterium]
MKRNIVILFVGLMILSSVQAEILGKGPDGSGADTLSYLPLSGIIIDENSGEPVVFANVFLQGTSIGTVTNTEGEFILKIPKHKAVGNVVVAFLGYENKNIQLSNLQGKHNKIVLKPLSIPLDEVVIKSIDPASVLRNAMSQIKANYSLEPEMQTAFYREAIRKNGNYVSIAEAVLDIYKSGYRNNFDFDRVKVYKGRKSSDVKRMDTLLVKFQGGPRTSLMLDVVKNPGDILDIEVFEYYDYRLAGMTKINNHESYVIEFDQKDFVEYPLYKGRIYVDSKSYAVVGLDFQFSEKRIEEVASLLVKKKPAGLDLDFQGGKYLVNYREMDGKWYLNYIRTEINFKAKWSKKLFRKNISTMFEMAVTDRSTENIVKIKYNESAKFTDVLAEDVTDFQDKDFWGDYNVIKPDQSIEVAIDKLGKQLKRKTK